MLRAQAHHDPSSLPDGVPPSGPFHAALLPQVHSHSAATEAFPDLAREPPVRARAWLTPRKPLGVRPQMRRELLGSGSEHASPEACKQTGHQSGTG